MTIEQQRTATPHDFWGVCMPKTIDVVATLIEGHWLAITIAFQEADRRREELEEKLKSDRLLFAAIVALLGVSDDSINATAASHLVKAIAARIARAFSEAACTDSAPSHVIQSVLSELVRVIDLSTDQTCEASCEALLE